MSDVFGRAAIAFLSVCFLLIAVASFRASSNGRWIAASGAAVLDTRTGRVCAIDAKGVSFCDDYARFGVTR